MNLKTISHYTIIRLLGSGGMGEVYLAEDIRLGRQVALKILSLESAAKSEKIARFEKEARAASALNHPNILTVYDVGESESCHYLVTEYVDGQSLRDYFSHGTVGLQRAIDIVIDVARALSAAHEKGIVHRDIKPDNIMIRTDGLVKVLDFGLAKLTEGDILRDTPVITAPGVIMGTPKYMSPEQIRGLAVDQRSDIFSLGVVFYEIIAGEPPFDGSTMGDVIASVLTNDPAPLPQYKPDISPSIPILIQRCLEKDASSRYQTMRSLIFDLERLNDQPEAEIREQSVTLRMESTPRNTPAGTVLRTSTIAVPATGGEPRRRLAEGSASWKPNRIILVAGLMLILIGTIGLVVFSYYSFKHKIDDPIFGPPRAAMSIRRLTTNGKTTSATISSDGKYIAYVVLETGKQSLWVRHLPTSKNVQVIPPADIQYENLRFSADNNYIYYLKTQGKIDASEVFMVPILGGTQKKVLGNTSSSFDLSPDGKQIVFSRFSEDQSEAYAITANLDGSNERKISTQKGQWLDFPAWSTDGQHIVFANSTSGPTFEANLVDIHLDDLRQTPIGNQKWAFVGTISFIAGGSGLLITAKDDLNHPTQIWKVSYPEGIASRVSNDLNSYTSANASSESKELVAVQINAATGIGIAALNDLNNTKQITSGSGHDGWMGTAWTPDGRIVYTATGDSGRDSDIWVMDADGSNQKQLTAGAGSNIQPVVSHDGRFVVFASNRSGGFSIWRMNVDGNNPVQLAAERPGIFPDVTPDGKWVIFQGFDLGPEGYPVPAPLWKTSIDGSTAQQLTNQNGAQPTISPDGKTVAFFTEKEILVMPVEGGDSKRAMTVERTFTMLPYRITIHLPYFRWLADSSGFVFAQRENETYGLWKLQLNKTAPERLSDFGGSAMNFSLSPEGQKLAYSRLAGGGSDAILISNW